MILQKLLDLKVGQHFLYQGCKATIIWTEDLKEEIGVWDGKMVYARHYAFYYKFPQDGREKDITFRGMWPHPETLDLKEFAELK